MNAITFDTHFFVKKLKDQGISEKHAEAIVDFVRDSKEMDLDTIATKSDLREIKVEIRELELKMQHQINELESRLIIKLGTMIIALGGLLIAIKYFG